MQTNSGTRGALSRRSVKARKLFFIHVPWSALDTWERGFRFDEGSGILFYLDGKLLCSNAFIFTTNAACACKDFLFS